MKIQVIERLVVYDYSNQISNLVTRFNNLFNNVSLVHNHDPGFMSGKFFFSEITLGDDNDLIAD